MNEEYDSTQDTLNHIKEVQNLLYNVFINLGQRSKIHDQSKLESPEKEIFDKYTPKLANNSEEYKSYLAQMKVALDHHYANNSHHPEYEYSNEKWIPINKYEGLYIVSSHGRIKSLSRIVKRSGDKGNLQINEKMLNLQPTPKGYLRVQLNKESKKKNFMVHQLVALAFIENPQNLPEINHIDTNKTNNNIKNLEWSTQSENMLHAYKTGLKESNAKYFIECIELDIITRGCCKMEQELHKRGYNKATAAGIYAAMDKETYLNFTFIGSLISKGHPQSMVRRMSLLDLIEMICDWKAETLRHKDGDILKSIEVTQKRFGYSDELKQIFLNTVKELKF